VSKFPIREIYDYPDLDLSQSRILAMRYNKKCHTSQAGQHFCKDDRQSQWKTDILTPCRSEIPLWTYRVGPKKVSQRRLHITSSNTVRFSKLFHCHILLEICNKAVIKYPTSPQTCCHTTSWNTYVSKLVRPKSVKCVTSFRFTKLKYDEYF